MKKVVTFGEVMLRLNPPGYLKLAQTTSLEMAFGGAESNVAVSLAQFGLPVSHVTRLPDNDLGRCAMMELRKYGVGVGHIAYGGQRLGLYFLQQGAVSRASEVIYDRAHSAMAALQPGMIDWQQALNGAGWFHLSGITPAISASAARACLEAVQVASAMGLPISLDLNYRAKLWQYGQAPTAVMPELVNHCHTALANENDARLMLGIQVANPVAGEAYQARIDAAAALNEQLAAQYPKVSNWAASVRTTHSASHHQFGGALYSRGQLCTARQYTITPMVDRVGGGDAFMAGLIYGLIKQPDNQQYSIDYAVAASCLKHTICGDVNLATVPEVEKLMAGNASARVLR